MYNRQKVLIVDDKSANLYALEQVLQVLEEVELVKASNGNDALIAILNHDFALAILDVQMPDMDGYELAEFIRSEEKSKFLPVIFLSAVFSDEFHVFKGYRAGAVDFITKPFNPEVLLSKVEIFLKLDMQKKELNEQNFLLEKEIFERKKIEQSLRENEQKLQDLNSTKDKFFSILAHDLRNPFNTIMGFSELLLTQKQYIPQDKAEHFYKLINEASKSAYNLLSNLLEWSRAQTGTISFIPLNFDVAQVVNESLKLLEGMATKKGIKFISEIQEKTEIFADMNMITTILRNLISNAIKFTFEGGTIKISASYHENFVHLEVNDNGMGIKEQDIQKLFKIDSNKSSLGTNNETGTGLGLILCKEFVERNGGEIWVKSVLTQGSSFIFSVPQKG